MPRDTERGKSHTPSDRLHTRQHAITIKAGASRGGTAVPPFRQEKGNAGKLKFQVIPLLRDEAWLEIFKKEHGRFEGNSLCSRKLKTHPTKMTTLFAFFSSFSRRQITVKEDSELSVILDVNIIF